MAPPLFPPFLQFIEQGLVLAFECIPGAEAILDVTEKAASCVLNEREAIRSWGHRRISVYQCRRWNEDSGTRRKLDDKLEVGEYEMTTNGMIEVASSENGAPTASAICKVDVRLTVRTRREVDGRSGKYAPLEDVSQAREVFV